MRLQDKVAFLYIRANGPAIYPAQPDGLRAGDWVLINTIVKSRAESPTIYIGVVLSSVFGSENRATLMLARKIQTAGPLALHLHCYFRPSPSGWAR